ncbi:uncharacterized protein KQ657_000845 [Scheffersomyces spartinae]|uniref:Phospholipid/glycerol acyltransferase domain-containing protein n=1 Tax=Scheffersomyces spartinae TaxID=45513 RepID=A0A9P7V901_9ASCO|nr:uncharacterized protein KQ657_000845 [Scheffersomyces spartinae]KAG7193427.1 hypothetical protein KQ657_000845 [Scheffersomyces spartinae]
MTTGYFDVNILADAFDQPVIVPFPLPETLLLDNDANVPFERNFRLLENFIWLITAGSLDLSLIYENQEYHYFFNKHSKKFQKLQREYLHDKLTHGDKKLDEIVNNLVDLELRMNLITSKEYPERCKAVKAYMVEYYTKENEKNLPLNQSSFVLHSAYATILTLFKRMFPQGVWVNSGEMETLFAKYRKNPMSIIYLPNHRSHIDYIIMHILALRFQMATPHVIAGENLNVAVFGGLLKKMGAIFIKRSFNNELYTERNLFNYLEFVFNQKIPLEVFIEGTRSRDGKSLLPKYGILKTCAAIYLKQTLEDNNPDFDLLIQPVSLTYERVYETDGYINELLGEDKKQESFLNIILNGATSFFNASKSLSYEDMCKQKDWYDNGAARLHGKMYCRLGNSFTMSEYISSEKQTTAIILEDNEPIYHIGQVEYEVNLKKLGFTVFHEINRICFLPEISVIGCGIYAYYYSKRIQPKEEFPIKDMLPTLRLLIETFLEEEKYAENEGNIVVLTNLQSMSDAELIKLIKVYVGRFFRFVKVNFSRSCLRVDTPIELLYYKNLTIHLIIHRSLACFIVLRTNRIDYMHKLFYVFTGFLKTEFLFDYDYNPRNQLSNLLKDLQDKAKIGAEYEVIDFDYVQLFTEFFNPFIESYILCIKNLNLAIANYYKLKEFEEPDYNYEQKLIAQTIDSGLFPTTKIVLKMIQASGNGQRYVESINKQYLLSCLFYLNHLRLIKIFKNKAKTKAFVAIRNPKDLNLILKALTLLYYEDSDKENVINIVNINYLIDIVDKNEDRTLKSQEVSKVKL